MFSSRRAGVAAPVDHSLSLTAAIQNLRRCAVNPTADRGSSGGLIAMDFDPVAVGVDDEGGNFRSASDQRP